MIDFSKEYYKWWIKSIIHHFCSVDEVYSYASREEQGFANNLDWLISSVLKIRNKSRHMNKKKAELNMEARVLGRTGEQLVHNILINNGWNIVEFTDQEIYPSFGKSPINYDIIANYCNNRNRLIEVKTFQSDAPFLSISYKHKRKIDKSLSGIENHFHVFVQGDKAFYVRTSQIKYLGYVQSLLNWQFPSQRKTNFLWVVDPMCLREIKEF